MKFKSTLVILMLLPLCLLSCRKASSPANRATSVNVVQNEGLDSSKDDVRLIGQPRPDVDDSAVRSLSLLQTIKLEANRSEIFPLFAFVDRSRWCARYDLTFRRYLPFYRFKKKVSASSPKEIDECIDNMDSLNNKEKAFVLAALFIYEKEKRVRSEETMKILKNKRVAILQYIVIRAAQELYVPAYVRSSNFYGRAIDFLLPYEPNSEIMPETWNRWTKIYLEYFQNSDVAFDILYPEELNNLDRDMLRILDDCGRGCIYQIRTPSDDLLKSGIKADWLKDLKECENLISVNLGIDVNTDYFPYEFLNFETFNVPGIWESEFSHHYMFCYPGMSTKVLSQGNLDVENTESPFMEKFLSATELLEPNPWPKTDELLEQIPWPKTDELLEQIPTSRTEIMQALREYWFVTQTFSPSPYFLSSEIVVSPYFGNSSNVPIYPVSLGKISNFILFNRFQYQDDVYHVGENKHFISVDGQKITINWWNESWE